MPGGSGKPAKHVAKTDLWVLSKFLAQHLHNRLFSDESSVFIRVHFTDDQPIILVGSTWGVKVQRDAQDGTMDFFTPRSKYNSSM